MVKWLAREITTLWKKSIKRTALQAGKYLVKVNKFTRIESLNFRITFFLYKIPILDILTLKQKKKKTYFRAERILKDDECMPILRCFRKR